MPELPEVETVRRVVDNWVKGRTISGVKILYPSIIDNVSPLEFSNLLIGQKFNNVSRYGKYLVFELNKNVIVSHLRMAGKYLLGYYKNEKNFKQGYEFDLKHYQTDKILKHVCVIFELDNGSILMYQDVRKFGRMQLSDKAHYRADTPLKKIGVEPFSCSPTYLKTKFKGKNVPLKQALLDQSILAGIGNIYADEICYMCNLSPYFLVKDLSDQQLESILNAAQVILTKAIELGGSTIHSFSYANSVDGKFQNEIKVYGHEKKKCEKCGTPIVKTYLGQRGTHFCPSCQALPLPKNVRVVGITGLIGSGKSSVSEAFLEHGYGVLDADAYSRQSLMVGTNCYHQVIKKFGPEILNEDHSINRQKLRQLISADVVKIKQLEKIIHPYVIAKIKAEIKRRSKEKLILDVPLLFEAGLDELCDLVVFVNTEKRTRHQRLLTRDTMPLQEAQSLNERVIAASEKIARSDYVIDNSDTRENTKRQVLHLLDLLEQQS